MRIPWTYCWSPELLPKPFDWKGHIDISGFYFLDNEDDYRPPSDLAEWLGLENIRIEDSGSSEGDERVGKGKGKQQNEVESEQALGKQPIYIGFGSVVIPDPEKVTCKPVPAFLSE